MSEFQETSQTDSNRKQLLHLAWFLLLVWTVWELDKWYLGTPSLLGLGFVPFFACLIIWRTEFRYVLMVNESRVAIRTMGLGLKRELIIPLDSITENTVRYDKKQYPLRKIDKYHHRYSSMDGNPQRAIVYLPPNKKKPQVAIYKSTEKFVQALDAALLGLKHNNTEGKGEKSGR